jgi:hypothetical protein
MIKACAIVVYKDRPLTECFPWSLSDFRFETWLMHTDVVCVHVMPWQLQEFVLVLPAKRLLLELLSLAGWKRWFRDLGDEIGSGSFCKTVDQNTHKWDFDEDIEAETKAKKHPRTILEPQLLLFLVVFDACKVRLELKSCECLL